MVLLLDPCLAVQYATTKPAVIMQDVVARKLAREIKVGFVEQNSFKRVVVIVVA